MSLGALLGAPEASVGEVRERLAGLPPPALLRECLALAPRRQRRLWELASPTPAAARGRLLTGTTAVFAGRNSLRLLSRFEKWFAEQDGEVVGCNRHALSPLLGPGYFTVREGGAGELAFDYGRVPDRAPAGWPAVRSNDRPAARPVYGGLLDRVVWVTPDVLVGAAFRGSAPLDSYFVLVRTAR